MPSAFSDASAGPAGHLRFDGVSRALSGRRVLTDVSFVVAAGERVGLIGENGSGKSTLLRIAAGLLEPDAGAVSVCTPGVCNPRVGLLHQEPPFSPQTTVRAAVELALAPVRRAADAVDRCARHLSQAPADADAAAGYARALEDAERLGAWDADARAATMLAGLGLADLPGERLTGELSGGQRARLALAWLLLHAPDVLLLDEPSNHLDDTAAAHLCGVLRAWPGPVLLASHDRVFLDETATALVDLDPTPIAHAVAGPLLDDGPGSGIGVFRFGGNYSDYLAARQSARQRWERRYREEQAELARLRAAVRDNHQVGHEVFTPRCEARAAKKFYADRNARVVARRVGASRSRLAELTREQVRKPDDQLRFVALDATDGAASGRSGEPGPVLEVAGLGVPGRLGPVGLRLDERDRWLVTGPNGVGKSTLLEVLAGRLMPGTGTVRTRPGLRIGLLTQDVCLPDPHRRGPGRSAERAYRDLVGDERAERTPLRGLGLIAPRDMNRETGALSVGQQRRLALACLLADPPQVLLLDEPTNHLSLPLVEALEAAIGNYPGAVVIASHDRWLRRRWSGQRLELQTCAPQRG